MGKGECFVGGGFLRELDILFLFRFCESDGLILEMVVKLVVNCKTIFTNYVYFFVSACFFFWIFPI